MVVAGPGEGALALLPAPAAATPPATTGSHPGVLWIDLRVHEASPALCERLADHCPVYRVTGAAAVPETIRKTSPHLLCFDYDDPDREGLRLLQQARREHAGLPVLMLTEYHSEALAVWALRTRVWDYLVKPVPIIDLVTRVTTLLALVGARRQDAARVNAMPLSPIPPGARVCRPAGPRRLQPAIAYVEADYAGKVRVEVAARLCGLGVFQFSRAFTREHGLTFQEFLARYRIRRAVQCLRHPQVSVTNVASAVGFDNLSDFARMFRRHVGMCLSEYRRRSGSSLGARPREELTPASLWGGTGHGAGARCCCGAARHSRCSDTAPFPLWLGPAGPGAPPAPGAGQGQSEPGGAPGPFSERPRHTLD